MVDTQWITEETRLSSGIGMANPACQSLDQNLAGSRLLQLNVDELERAALGLDLDGAIALG